MVDVSTKGIELMNYGHPLKFGLAISPSNTVPDEVVALVKRGEALGYDLVTFQEASEHEAQLDSWTLLTWLAGQTSKIQLAPTS
jgi:alkanesulfonate monooxygenase SsuD/methylene tetrahydromethanopterin reductase-like flavin-dependent oxidoreductase (luciferase family)